MPRTFPWLLRGPGTLLSHNHSSRPLSIRVFPSIVHPFATCHQKYIYNIYPRTQQQFSSLTPPPHFNPRPRNKITCHFPFLQAEGHFRKKEKRRSEVISFEGMGCGNARRILGNHAVLLYYQAVSGSLINSINRVEQQTTETKKGRG